MTRRAAWAAAAAIAAMSSAGCKRSPMARIEGLRDALAVGNRESALAVVEVAACANPHARATAAACLDAEARAFGATAGWSADRPDQASAAAAAHFLLRYDDGSAMPGADVWLGAIAGGKGPGADALRIALAEAMTAETPLVGKRIEDVASARSLLGAVSRAIPGACETYTALSRGADPYAMPAAESPDHAPCVQHDLERRDGPGAAYGDGLWRAAAGAAALWKEAGKALVIGFGMTDGAARRAIEKRLGGIEAATKGMAVKVVGTTQNAGYGGEGHGEGGVGR